MVRFGNHGLRRARGRSLDLYLQNILEKEILIYFSYSYFRFTLITSASTSLLLSVFTLTEALRYIASRNTAVPAAFLLPIVSNKNKQD